MLVVRVYINLACEIVWDTSESFVRFKRRFSNHLATQNTAWKDGDFLCNDVYLYDCSMKDIDYSLPADI